MKQPQHRAQRRCPAVAGHRAALEAGRAVGHRSPANLLEAGVPWP